MMEQECLVLECTYKALHFLFHFNAELINSKVQPCGFYVETSQI